MGAGWGGGGGDHTQTHTYMCLINCAFDNLKTGRGTCPLATPLSTPMLLLLNKLISFFVLFVAHMHSKDIAGLFFLLFFLNYF